MKHWIKFHRNLRWYATCVGLLSMESPTDEVLSITLTTNVFVFRDFKIHHKDWLTYSSETDRPGKLCYNFSISSNLDLHRPGLFNLFLPSNTSIVVFPFIGKFWSHCCLSFHWLTFKLKRWYLSIIQLTTILVLISKKKLYGPFLWIGSTVSRLQSHYEETVYFLPLSPQEFLVLILSTWEGLVKLRATQWFWTWNP